jgi:steroid 5-alpha reductase family enzyme
MNLLGLLLVNLGAAAVVMAVAWCVHLVTGKASVADSFWGPGFAVIALLSFGLTDGDPASKSLIVVLVTVWALRLAWHVTERSMGQPEDPRYADMRAAHPKYFPLRSLLTVFLLQAVIMWLVSLPVQLGMRAPASPGLGFLDWLGLLLWLFGFFWEAMGDEQLRRFKADPANRGKVLDYGLWRYTRHPNYFGEACMWWALFLVACGAEGGWWSFIGPLLLTVLLLRVSGVALTEKKMEERHDDYAEYKRRTSAFLPMPPRDVSR